MKLTKRQLRVIISEALGGDDNLSQSFDKPGGNVSVDVDFFDEDGSVAALFPQHPVTVSVTGRNNGMPTVLVQGPRELVKKYLLKAYSNDEEEVDFLIDGN